MRFEEVGGDIVFSGDEPIVATGGACGIGFDGSDDVIFFDKDAAVVFSVADELTHFLMEQR